MYYCTVQQYSSALCTQYTLAVLYSSWLLYYCTVTVLYSSATVHYVYYWHFCDTLVIRR